MGTLGEKMQATLQSLVQDGKQLLQLANTTLYITAVKRRGYHTAFAHATFTHVSEVSLFELHP